MRISQFFAGFSHFFSLAPSKQGLAALFVRQVGKYSGKTDLSPGADVVAAAGKGRRVAAFAAAGRGLPFRLFSPQETYFLYRRSML